MPRSYGQKVKLLFLADIFRRETDEQHPITIKDIIARLDENGIPAERKSLYNDIDMLNESYGMDICAVREKSTTKYFLANRDFQLPELQLLADAVACSKFITESKSKELIGKIEKLTSVYQARALGRSVIVANRVKTINEKIYYNIQALHEAIQAGRQISFLYFSYDIKKNKVYKRNGERYVMSPYSLAWEDENYYCVGYYETYSCISNFRVDRMEDIQCTDMKIKEDCSFNITEYSRRVFGMFRGETVRAKLKFDNSLTGVVMDKFGTDITMHRIDDNSFYISHDINVSPTFLAWMFTFGDKAAIMSPESLKNSMREHIASVLSTLGDKQE